MSVKISPLPHIQPEGVETTRCWNEIGVWGNSSCPELRRSLHCHSCPVYAAAAVRLLDREVPDDYRQTWTTQIAGHRHVTEPGTLSVVAFRIGTEWLALPTSVFHGVAVRCPVHALPHRSGRGNKNGLILGVTNVNGELLICVSLSALLGTATAAGESGRAKGSIYPRLLIASEEGGGRVTFPVDEVHGLLRYHPHELQEVPETLAKAGTRFTRGLITWQQEESRGMENRGKIGEWRRTLACLDETLVFYAMTKGLA